MNERENYIRTITFNNPEWIPVFFAINPACYFTYDQDKLFTLMENHQRLFPGFKRPVGKFTPELSNMSKKGAYYYDHFGCKWESKMDGILGVVTEHPLADIDNLKDYKFPNPDNSTGLFPIDWIEEEKRINKLKENDSLVLAGLRHGHTFLQMCDIRGYEDFLVDMMEEEEYLKPFLEKLTDFNTGLIDHYIKIGVDVFQIPEDLGMQVGPMLSVDNFNEYILPCYKKLVEHAKKNGTLVHMHSDGDIRLLADKIIMNGVDCINLQDLVNGIDWIRDNLKGKVCIDLDVDRQKITRFGTKEDIRNLIKEEVSKLGDKKGGLMFTYGLYPGIPLENVEALMDAFEEFMDIR